MLNNKWEFTFRKNIVIFVAASLGAVYYLTIKYGRLKTPLRAMKIKTFYHNRLPHLAPVGGTFFVTFRLANSIPLEIIKKFQEQKDQQIAALLRKRSNRLQTQLQKIHQQFFNAYDDYLDLNSKDKCYLSLPAIATVLINKLHEYDGKYYDLQAYCVMPNHVHLLIDTSIQLLQEDGSISSQPPEDYVQLDKIMNLIKGGSSYEANLILKRTGVFWQKDSYDRLIRDEKEWCNTVDYILNNPVKAKLISNWEDWEYSFYKYS